MNEKTVEMGHFNRQLTTMPRPKGHAVDGQFIRSRRENSQYTQDALAVRCGLTRALIQKAERGGPLSTSSISKIAAALGVSDSALILEEGWHQFSEDRLMIPFRPGEAAKVGDIWGQPRETIYNLEPRSLLIVALRSSARVLPAYSPRNASGTKHLHRLIEGIKVARTGLLDLGSRGRGRGLPAFADTVKSLADDAYLAASFARPAEYEDDPHAADAGFAVGIAVARVLDSLWLECKRKTLAEDADHWRAVELATSACHACSHASVYLKIGTHFLRSATLDTHDVRNSRHVTELLSTPVWCDGQIPPVLDLYMARFIRLRHFDAASRITWNKWARKRFG